MRLLSKLSTIVSFAPPPKKNPNRMRNVESVEGRIKCTKTGLCGSRKRCDCVDVAKIFSFVSDHDKTCIVQLKKTLNPKQKYRVSAMIQTHKAWRVSPKTVVGILSEI